MPRPQRVGPSRRQRHRASTPSIATAARTSLLLHAGPRSRPGRDRDGIRGRPDLAGSGRVHASDGADQRGSLRRRGSVLRVNPRVHRGTGIPHRPTAVSSRQCTGRAAGGSPRRRRGSGRSRALARRANSCACSYRHRSRSTRAGRASPRHDHRRPRGTWPGRTCDGIGSRRRRVGRRAHPRCPRRSRGSPSSARIIMGTVGAGPILRDLAEHRLRPGTAPSPCRRSHRRREGDRSDRTRRGRLRRCFRVGRGPGAAERSSSATPR